jgi:uncharacterized ferritin-like protein (DUF455 family)
MTQAAGRAIIGAVRLRDFALRILSEPTLEAKLAPPPEPLEDDDPGEPLFWAAPARPESLRVRTRSTRVRLPKPSSLGDPRKRALTLHFFANHELQAIEMMAFALLAYPAAPRGFRAGVLRTLLDEQGHLRLYMDRLEELGMRFGDVPVSDAFWAKTPHLNTPLDYVATLPLTLENGNLDHAPRYEELFRAAGDERSAALMRRIFEDEVAHVRFGLTWLRRLKDPAASDWEAFAEHLAWPLRPSKARGPEFRAAGRVAAGFDPDFIARLERAVE